MQIFLARAVVALVYAAPVFAQVPSPDALLVVDQHREAIVERTIAAWPGGLTADRADALRATLWSLRSDRLLAASLSPGLDSLLASVATADRLETTADVRGAPKALGSASGDLVYTPLTPCRIADTRIAVGALAANTTRTLLGFHATSFASQGGTATPCAIPNGVAALAMNVYAVNPSALGFIKLWASNQTEPAVSTVNYEPPTVAIATGALVPVNAGDSNKFNAKSPAGVHLVVDVVGYFRAPFAAGTGLRITRDATVDTLNSINGSSANSATAGVRGATIAGGGVPSGSSDPDFAFEAPHLVGDHYGTIGGGFANTVGDGAGSPVDKPFATVAGGAFNVASGPYATIAGGGGNTASMSYGMVGGGQENAALNAHAAVMGGRQNMASGAYSMVGGGDGNQATGTESAVGGGRQNFATGEATFVGGGRFNQATGEYAAVLGGLLAEANGYLSFAMGGGAKTNSTGSFVYADASQGNFFSAVDNEFLVAASGGIGLYTNKNYSTFCRIGAGGGSWTCSSSRDVKRDFEQVDAADVLRRVVALPLSTWRFVTEPATVRHLGPMAQDFRAAFALGDDERSITAVDADGVAFAAIQGLHAKLEAKERDIAALTARLEALVDRLAAIERAR